jgi:hypothetical protein
MDFVGHWVNEEGNILLIRRFFESWYRYRVRYIRKDGRLLLKNRINLFMHMFPFGCFGKIEGERLIVDLGGGPLGPNLELRLCKDLDKDREMLLPEIIPSLSGWEDIVRIEWLEPLSPFHRVK